MMEITTLVVLLAIEIAINVFCLVKNNRQPLVRSVLRLGTFGLFLLLVILGVYEWRGVWYLAAFYLAVKAIYGGIYLLRQRFGAKDESPVKQGSAFRRSRAIFSGIGWLLLIIICMLPVLVFPQYTPPEVTGQYLVAEADWTFIDDSRVEDFIATGEKRAVTVSFWYPEDGTGTYPLVVFSHGAFGVKESNLSAYKELASHGYIVCSVEHPFHAPFSRSMDGKLTLINPGYAQEVALANTEDCSPQETEVLYRKWMKLRTDDLNFIIDTVLAEGAAGESENNAARIKVERKTLSTIEFKSAEADMGYNNERTDGDYSKIAAICRMIDRDKIGVFGHSMGGAASVAMMRERDDIDAVINIDGPYFSEISYDETIGNLAVNNNDIFTTPLLNIYSDDVWQQLETVPTYAGNKAAADNPEVYTSYFQGAKHLSITDLSLTSPLLANLLQGGKSEIDRYYCLENMNQIILRFFDCHLKGQGDFVPRNF